MRIAFLGTSAFAVPSLQALVDDTSIHVCAVITQEDRPQGRGHRLLPTPVKAFALERRLPVYQPAKIQAEESRRLFETLAAELLIVVSYGQILPGWLLDMPRLGAVNVHASLLPKYRGAAPIQWAILNGEAATGVTTMKMDTGMDSGPILLQQAVSIPETETAGELHDRLAVLGAGMLISTLRRMEEGTLDSFVQNNAQATLAPKITKEMGRIDWTRSASDLHNQIRGLNPWPGCFCLFRGMELKIWRSAPPAPQGEARSSPGRPGRIKVGERGRFQVQCGDGRLLELLEVSLPSRKRISGADLVHGFKIQEGEDLESAIVAGAHE